jgi:hypothetical protein
LKGLARWDGDAAGSKVGGEGFQSAERWNKLWPWVPSAQSWTPSHRRKPCVIIQNMPTGGDTDIMAVSDAYDEGAVILLHAVEKPWPLQGKKEENYTRFTNKRPVKQATFVRLLSGAFGICRIKGAVRDFSPLGRARPLNLRAVSVETDATDALETRCSFVL